MAPPSMVPPSSAAPPSGPPPDSEAKDDNELEAPVQLTDTVAESSKVDEASGSISPAYPSEDPLVQSGPKKGEKKPEHMTPPSTVPVSPSNAAPPSDPPPNSEVKDDSELEAPTGRSAPQDKPIPKSQRSKKTIEL